MARFLPNHPKEVQHDRGIPSVMMSDRLTLCPDDWKECDRTLKSEDA
ncbi:MAG TPA: hypothetical protein V6D31_01320 [Candidatus Sericytochromatia bacterium]